MDKAKLKLEKGVKNRLALVCLAFTCGLSLLSARLVYLQVVVHEKYAEAAADHYRYREELPASRGMIVDLNGDLLARNRTVYSVVVDCVHIRDIGYSSAGVARKRGLQKREVRNRYSREEIFAQYVDHLSDTLSGILRRPKGELKRTLVDKERGEIVLDRDVDEDLAREYQDLMADNGIRGVYLRRGERRYYPSPLSLAHVIGYVQEVEEKNERGRTVKRLVGREGVEKVFDEVMTGTPGYRDVERDNRKQEIHAFRGEEQKPVDGKTIRLTINMGLQTKLEEVLDEAWERFTPEKIASVWMDPRTGEILAMASRPSFDLASRKGDRRHIAVSDQYEPGSTFKIVAAAGALNEGLVSPGTQIFCHNGLYEKDGIKLRDAGFYDHLSMEDVIMKSSNIGIYKLGLQLNRAPFHDYATRFGFGAPTGIELTSETGGALDSYRRWNPTDYSRIVMGYRVGVTPLQITNAYCVIANGGELLQPRILKSIESPDGRVLERTRPTAVRRVITERTARQMRQALLKVTGPGGTGTNAAIPGYDVCGKTGTAQKVIPGKGYASGRYVVSFAGFLPADDPELVGLVVVDDPRADGIKLYGGTIAAPIWKEFAIQATRLRGIPPADAEVHRLAEMEPDEVMLEGITD